MEKKFPEKTKSFEYKGVKYTVEFPDTGDLMDMASLKSRLLDGQHEALSRSMQIDSRLALTISEAVAFLNVNCPDLQRSLNVKSLLDLNLIDMREIAGIYLKDISPWYIDWIKKLNEPMQIEEEEKDG